MGKRTKWLTTCFILLILNKSQAQQTKEQFNIAVRYLLSLPGGYDDDTTKKWPLMIFLHGSGESGSDIEKVKVHGPPKLIEQGKKFPFIVVSPQADPGRGWQPEIMEQFLRHFKSQYRIDKDRVYLTGLSMGGYGTWNWAAKYPKEFAAIVPICGGGDSSEAAKLKDIAIWCFHGGRDEVVRPEESYAMMNAVKRVNPSAKLTIYPEAGHDSWTATYSNDSLYTWLLQQKRKTFQAIRVAESALKEYEGYYSRTGKDSLKLVVESGKLMAKTGHPDLELSPTAKDAFFITEDDTPFEIRFTRNRSGKIEKLVFYGDRQFEFRRL